MSSVKPKIKNTVKEEKTVKKEPVDLASEKMEKISPSPSFTKRGAIQMPVYNMEGREVEKIKLPERIFGLKLNSDLVRQAIEAQMSQARVHYAHTKDRGEVSGGGKKPWRQKGTGRARHGSNRSPIWIGGGVTHGPRKEKNFIKKINKKMRRQAMFMVLSGKARDNEIIILDDLKLEQPKTKLMARVIQNFRPTGDHSKGKKSKFKSDLDRGTLIILARKDENVLRASRNIMKLGTIGAGSLNLVDLLNYKYLLMPKEAIEIIDKTYGTDRTNRKK